MNVLNSLRVRMGAAAFAAVSMTTLAPKPAPVELTRADVDWSNDKVAQAYGALVTMWTNDFRQIGAQFAAPRIARYTGAANTPCGIIRPNNAQYCARSNAIY